MSELTCVSHARIVDEDVYLILGLYDFLDDSLGVLILGDIEGQFLDGITAEPFHAFKSARRRVDSTSSSRKLLGSEIVVKTVRIGPYDKRKETYSANPMPPLEHPVTSTTVLEDIL